MLNQENLVTAQNLETVEDRMTLAYDKKIILADESEWRGTAGLDPENLSLWIWLDEGYEMGEVFTAFSDPKNLLIIKTVVESKLDYDVFTQEYEGYVNMVDFKLRDRKISIRLNKNP